jgi:protoporphyrinogen IX oxidase
MIVWFKFVHICAIAIWCAGLIALPGLYVQRVHAHDKDTLYRLQGLVRFAYVALISPAAFIAVGTGIALIFLRETYEPWFHLKLAFVAMLVVTHILTGLVIIRLFEEGEVYPTWRFLVVTALTVLIATLIIAVVLLKPDMSVDFLPDAMFRPGALREIVGDLVPGFIYRD